MKRLFPILTACLLLCVISVLYAQEPSQQLEINLTVNGVIDSTNPSRAWAFEGRQDEIVSFRVQASPTLDPILTIRDPDDQLVITNDDFDYPETRDALIEAVRLPDSGTYTVIVSGYEQTQGSFTLVALPGYGQVSLDENFSNAGSWQGNNLSRVQFNDGTAALETSGVGTGGTLLNSDLPAVDDFYVKMTVVQVSGSDGWAVGLRLRQQGNGDYYLLLVDQRGTWRFSAIEGREERLIQDWITNPAIPAGTSTFDLGVLARGSRYTVFFNGRQVDQVTDDSLQSGRPGIALQSSAAGDSSVSASVDRLQVTIPASRVSAVVAADMLIGGVNETQIIQELETRRIIPPTGMIAWAVESSFVETSGPGVNRFLLVESTAFSDFVMGATVARNVSGDGLAACGLVFGNADGTTYSLAYIDSAGGYGIALRNGDTFLPGSFGMQPRWADATQHDLLITLVDGLAILYVNREYAGQHLIGEINGPVGNAAINFDPVQTNCQFSDTWVWNLNP